MLRKLCLISAALLPTSASATLLDTLFVYQWGETFGLTDEIITKYVNWYLFEASDIPAGTNFIKIDLTIDGLHAIQARYEDLGFGDGSLSFYFEGLADVFADGKLLANDQVFNLIFCDLSEDDPYCDGVLGYGFVFNIEMYQPDINEFLANFGSFEVRTVDLVFSDPENQFRDATWAFFAYWELRLYAKFYGSAPPGSVPVSPTWPLFGLGLAGVAAMRRAALMSPRT